MAAVRYLEFLPFAFSSRNLRHRVILLRHSTFRISRTTRRWDVAEENDFQYGVRSPYWICYDVITLHPGTIFYVSNIVLDFQVYWFNTLW